jgi:hypothetical protein
MTPLQLLTTVLAERHGCPAPRTDAAPELRAWRVRHSVVGREQEVVDYVIAASDGTLGDRGGRMSLKHLLWCLRDLGRDQFQKAGAAVLRLVLDHPEVSLSQIDRESLVAALSCAECAQAAVRIVTASEPTELLKLVQVTQAGPWLVGTTMSPRNLLGLVMRFTDADLYVAASRRGSVVKARRDTAFPMQQLVTRLNALMGGWLRPHSDYALRRESSDLEALLLQIAITPRPTEGGLMDNQQNLEVW